MRERSKGSPTTTTAHPQTRTPAESDAHMPGPGQDHISNHPGGLRLPSSTATSRGGVGLRLVLPSQQHQHQHQRRPRGACMCAYACMYLSVYGTILTTPLHHRHNE